jgi:hypothetical protein
MGIAALHPSYEANGFLRRTSPPLSVQFVLLALLAFAKALRDGRSSKDQRSLIREALREIGVILLYDVEHGVLGKPSMVLGKESVQVSELFVVHGHRASAAIPKIYRNRLIPCELSTRLVTFRGRSLMLSAAAAHPRRQARCLPVNHLLTIAA